MRVREVDQRVHRIPRMQAHDLGAELAGERDVREQVALRLRVDEVWRLAWRLDVDHEPVGVEAAGEAGAPA